MTLQLPASLALFFEALRTRPLQRGQRREQAVGEAVMRWQSLS
jgi:hypothetical protein